MWAMPEKVLTDAFGCSTSKRNREFKMRRSRLAFAEETEMTEEEGINAIGTASFILRFDSPSMLLVST